MNEHWSRRFLLGFSAALGLAAGVALRPDSGRADDPFAAISSDLDSPGYHAANVTPDNSNDLPTTARALYVGGAGDVKVTTAGGDTVTFVGVAAGSVLPVRTKRVFATGTTGTSILALW